MVGEGLSGKWQFTSDLKEVKKKMRRCLGENIRRGSQCRDSECIWTESAECPPKSKGAREAGAEHVGAA